MEPPRGERKVHGGIILYFGPSNARRDRGGGLLSDGTRRCAGGGAGAGNLHGRLQTEHTKGNGRIFGRGVGGGKGHRRPSARGSGRIGREEKMYNNNDGHRKNTYVGGTERTDPRASRIIRTPVIVAADRRVRPAAFFPTAPPPAVHVHFRVYNVRKKNNIRSCVPYISTDTQNATKVHDVWTLEIIFCAVSSELKYSAIKHVFLVWVVLGGNT